MFKKEQIIIKTPVSYLQLNFEQFVLERLIFIEEEKIDISLLSNNKMLSDMPDIKKAICQLLAYFENPKLAFNIVCKIQGSIFQKKVWAALIKIPVGTVKTYSELAAELKTHPRAIGNACRMNPIPIIVPCHRIISKQNVGGYMGDTSITGKWVKIKQWLLKHESAFE